MWRGKLAVLSLLTSLSSGQPFAGYVLEQHSEMPIRGARVQVKAAGASRLTADLETVRDGTFRADGGVPSAEYTVTVSKQNYVDASLRMHLPIREPIAIRLLRLASISGHVTDAQNRPMVGVQVLPMVVESDTIFRPMAVGARTDDKGQYKLYALVPGRYVVAVSWASLNSGVTASGAYLFPNNQRPQIFAVASGDAVRDIDFSPLPGSRHTISGRLQNLSSGKDGAVTLVPREQPAIAAAITSTTAGGNFAFDKIAPGSYELLSAAPSNAYGAREVMLGSDPVFARLPVEVGGSRLLDLTLLSQPGRSLRVSLRSETGCPSVATVSLAPLENWGAMLQRTLELDTAAPVSIKDLAPGRYRAVALKPAAVCFGVEQTFDTRTAEALQLTLVRGGNLEGRIESVNSRPVVTLTRLDVERPGIQHELPETDARFQFSDLRPGRYFVQAGSVGENIVILSNKTTPVLLRLGGHSQ